MDLYVYLSIIFHCWTWKCRYFYDALCSAVCSMSTTPSMRNNRLFVEQKLESYCSFAIENQILMTSYSHSSLYLIRVDILAKWHRQIFPIVFSFKNSFNIHNRFIVIVSFQLKFSNFLCVQICTSRLECNESTMFYMPLAT